MSPRALSYTPPVTGSSSPMTTPACYNAHSSFFEVLQLYAAIVFLVWVCLYQVPGGGGGRTKSNKINLLFLA